MRLGIIIPYYKNSIVCEEKFKLLMEVINNQLTSDMILYIYEDGQYSDWLDEYVGYHNIFVFGDEENHGVSYARNQGLEFFFHPYVDIDYILFLDSDDMIDKNYLKIMYKAMDGKTDILESRFFVKDRILKFGINDIRTGCCGSCIRAELIKNIRFDENLLIGEDTKFMQDLWKNHKIKKNLVETNYYYNLGSNANSLWMRYQRHKIDKDKILEGK